MAAIARYSLLSFPLTSFGLGIWQLYRLDWKRTLIADIESRTSHEPIDLLKIDSLQDLDTLEYHKVKVSGQYDTEPKNQIFIKPRTLVINREARLRGRSEQQINTGVHVVTPFNVDKSNLRILVNRGWLPLRKYRELAPNGLTEEDQKGPREVVGIIRKSEKMRGINVANNEESDEWNYRDVDALAKVLKTAPIYIEAVENWPLGNPGQPIGGQTRLTIKNDHLSYAITWFGLAVLSFGMWFTKYGPKTPKHLHR